jgi:Putative transposase
VGRLRQGAVRRTGTGLRYLSRYTHRVAISNQRLLTADDSGVAFRWKDYRLDGPDRWKTMTLHPHELIRRFLIHVLPKGFHRIRHYGLFANGNRADNIARARELLSVPPPVKEAVEEKGAADDPRVLPCPCPRCGGRMIIIETFAEGNSADLMARGYPHQDRYLVISLPPASRKAVHLPAGNPRQRRRLPNRLSQRLQRQYFRPSPEVRPPTSKPYRHAQRFLTSNSATVGAPKSP